MSRSAKVANIETQLPSINVRIVTWCRVATKAAPRDTEASSCPSVRAGDSALKMGRIRVAAEPPRGRDNRSADRCSTDRSSADPGSTFDRTG
jgi:hypothetical protein